MQVNPSGSRERLSKQLVRVLLVMQSLYAGAKTVDGVSLAIGDRWCQRTIRRDLELLVAIGFVRRHVFKLTDSFGKRTCYEYEVMVGQIADPLRLPDGI